MKDKKILILIWNLGIGGVQKRVKDIISDLNFNYANVKVLLLVKKKTNKGDWQSIEKLKNVKIIFFPTYLKIFYKLGFGLWVFGEIIWFKPDVILTFLCELSIIAIILKRILFFLKFKVIINEVAVTSRYLFLNNFNYLKHFIKPVYNKSDLIIVPTKACRDDLINNFGVTSKIQVIPNWTMFKPDKIKYITSNDLLFAGRFEKEKNPELFLNIFKKLSEKIVGLRGMMVGDGSLKKNLEKYIVQHGLKWCKLVDFDSDIKKYLRISKLLLVTSSNEGMPNIVLEAAICKVPVISANFPGIEEIIIQNRTGIIAKREEKMIDLTEKLLKSRILREKLALNAQKHVLNNYGEINQYNFIQSLFSVID
jgi:glycosyltransferase involved in cell wall biosynthesis